MPGETTEQQQPTTKFDVLSIADLMAAGFNPAELKLLQFSVEELMGRTLLVNMEDGQRLCAHPEGTICFHTKIPPCEEM